MTSPRQWEVKLLDSGRCEPLKAVVHGVLFATVGVCAAYNTAAWLRRRQRHLAINAVIYTAALVWERCHIVHHLAACSDRGPAGIRESAATPLDLSDAA